MFEGFVSKNTKEFFLEHTLKSVVITSKYVKRIKTDLPKLLINNQQPLKKFPNKNFTKPNELNNNKTKESTFKFLTPIPHQYF